MAAQTHSRAYLSRFAIAGAFLLAGLSAAGAAASSPLIPQADAGGPGGESAVVAETDEGWYVIVDEQGNAVVPEQNGNGAVETARTTGSYAIVGEGGQSYVPERVGDGAPDGPILVGSGPEREMVANSDRQEQAGMIDETARATDLIALEGGTETASVGALDGPSLVGSGPDREIVGNSDRQETAGTLDETARSADLIALSPDAANDTAAARHGQPY
jgi:hypothetical protein